MNKLFRIMFLLVVTSMILTACGPAATQASDAVAFDYNADGRSDIAFHSPGSSWGTVPVLVSNEDGGWNSMDNATPSWANQPGVIAIPGDYNEDGRNDIAFHRPGGTWDTVPVLLSNADGTWNSTNNPASDWANQPGVIAIPGDYNEDGRSDIAFHSPGSAWGTVPVLLSNADGSWNSINSAAPDWANQPGVIAIPGDYNEDGRSDIAFHSPGSAWGTVPVLLSNADGSWNSINSAAPDWANQPGAIAVRGYSTHYDPLDNVQDSGDAAYDWTRNDETAWREDFRNWASSLRWIRSTPPTRFDKEGFLARIGLTGAYDGWLPTYIGSPQVRTFIFLEDREGEAHGSLTLLQPTELDFGFCGDISLPITTFIVSMMRTPPSSPSPYDYNTRFIASGITKRDISLLGMFSGETEIRFQMELLNSDIMGTCSPNGCSILNVEIDMDVPWPCQDQHFGFWLERRNDALFHLFGYRGFRQIYFAPRAYSGAIR